MKIRILGSCAEGGLPHWNCGCPNCVRARAGDPALPRRTRLSVAISGDGRRWSLLGVGADVGDQLARFPALHPRPGTRDLPLDAVVLTDAGLDAVAGLLRMRDLLSYRVLSTVWVRDVLLEHNAAVRPLEPAWGAVPVDRPFPLDADGRLEGRFFPVPGPPPGWTGGLARRRPESCVAVRLTDLETGARLVYAPRVAEADDATWAEIDAAHCALVDGTFFSWDEPRAARPGAPDAMAQGHVPIGGPDASLERLASHPGRRIYVHMSHTNPVLDLESKERTRVEEAGVEIAMEGMELEL